MSNTPQPEKRGEKTPDNTMDYPLPGSDGPVPTPTASGVAKPIEESERAGGINPGQPGPVEQAKSQPPRKQD